MRSGSPVIEPVLQYDEARDASARARRHLLYVVFTVVVSAVVGFAVVEAVVGIPGYGIDTTVSRGSAGETELEVRHADATRGQLAVPFEITLRRQGGFDGQVTLAVSRSYLDLFLTSGVSPSPARETSTADDLILTFDAPTQGDTMTVSWDVVTKPSASFTTRHGTVSVLDASGRPEVSVSFDTEVRV